MFGSGKSAGDGGSGAWEKDAEGLETRRTVDAGAIVLAVVEGYAVRIGVKSARKPALGTLSLRRASDMSQAV